MNEFVLNPVYEKVITDLIDQKYSIIENFFSDEEISSLRKSLLDKYDDNEFKKSAIGNLVNEIIVEEIRGDFISWIDEADTNSTEKEFFNKIDDFVNYLNRTCYMGIADKEFHYALYPKGTFYKRHLDAFQTDNSRKLSIVCYLNDENWKPEYGGELAIYLDNNGKEVTEIVYPVKGRMVVFESQVLEHEVKPVQKERLSITGWLKTRGNEVIF